MDPPSRRRRTARSSPLPAHLPALPLPPLLPAASGDAAIVEFIEGKPVIYHDRNATVRRCLCACRPAPCCNMRRWDVMAAAPPCAQQLPSHPALHTCVVPLCASAGDDQRPE